MAIAAFCLIASSVYILNDIFDLEKDKLHEVKRARPLATGAVSVSAASGLLVLLAAAALTIANFISLPFLSVIAGYFGLNILYSLYLKHISLIDISIIAIGFILLIGIVLFRSIAIIVLSKIPCLIPLAITAGLMGFLNIHFRSWCSAGVMIRMAIITAAPNTCHQTEILLKIACTWLLKQLSTVISNIIIANQKNCCFI